MADNKNVVDKTNLTTHTGVEVDSTKVASQNWISQITAGDNVTYDIATHHAITFKDGNDDNVGVKWNGLTDLEIVIPTIKDIVQTPIEFAGTVDAEGNIKYNAEHQDGPQTGYLVFFTADCPKFSEAEIACEAGDMAIYDGGKWNVVSGENQVAIVGNNGDAKTTVKVGAAQDVLTVEGKTLALVLDYADLNTNHLDVTHAGSAAAAVPVKFGNMTVDSIGIKLNKGADVPTTIGEVETFQVATQLENGTVNLENASGLVNNIVWGNFDQGTLPEFTPNSEKKLPVAGGVLTNLSTGSDFVSNVTLADVTFAPADSNDENKIEMLTGITAVSGRSFLTNVDGANSFTIAAHFNPEGGENAKFVTGISGGVNPVTDITEGSFTLVSGSDLATGFTTEASTGEVLSSVVVSANNDTKVLNVASVSNHVLSFGTTEVTSSVSTSYGYKSLTKTGFNYVAPSAVTAAFTTSGFTKVDEVTHTFGSEQETTYTTTSSMWKLNTPALDVKKGAYEIDHTNMKATIESGVFVASATQGTLPTWTNMSFSTTTVTGSVSTALTKESVSVNALKDNTINLPGVYSLETVATGGDITVGKAGELSAKNATIDLSTFVTDVAIVETKQ